MSSHREAPEISKDPVADSTDVYAFVSPDKPDTVTMIANYVPLQAPDGGPNFYEFGDDVLYEIHVDNNGDSKADVTYQFKFTSVLTIPSLFLYNAGPITITNGRLELANWNRRQYFSVTKVVGTKSTVLASNLACPPCNIGPLSTPSYNDAPSAAGQPEDFTKAFIYTLPSGETVFAGQRAEGFYVDLGAVFDLGGIRNIAELHNDFGQTALGSMPGVNSTAAVNVHSIAIQVPITAVSKGGTTPTNAKVPASVIGVWTTASRQTATMRNAPGKPTYSGPYVQVSRLGNPLFNEVLVGLGSKDQWNASPPSGDKAYVAGVANPTLAQLIPALYSGSDGKESYFPNLAALNADLENKSSDRYAAGRADLVAILLTGLPYNAITTDGKNGHPDDSTALDYSTFTGTTQADMLRLNLAIPPTGSTESPGTPSNLGLLGGDVAGFPNGRRVFDDVANIELKALAGATYSYVDPENTYTPDAAVADVNEGLTTKNPSGSSDGTYSTTDQTANGTVAYLKAFPYLGTPHSGYYTPSVTPPASNTPPAS